MIWPFRKRRVPVPVPAPLQVQVQVNGISEIKHVIERMPVPKPFGGTVIARNTAGEEIRYRVMVEYGWRSPPMHIADGFNDVHIEWDRS